MRVSSPSKILSVDGQDSMRRNSVARLNIWGCIECQIRSLIFCEPFDANPVSWRRTARSPCSVTALSMRSSRDEVM